MGNVRGQRLYVNLPASQARKRLKGFGHGVRKVESAGRNQALIIHTATRRHLEELEALFDDVAIAGDLFDLGEPVENLKNLGATGAAWLRDVGIFTISELREVGPPAAYRRVAEHQPKTSLNLLWAIAAGLQDRDWRDLGDEEKNRLRQQLREL